MVDRVHADEGSAVNILQLVFIQQMGLETKINKSARSQTGFKGATMITVGKIDLDVYSPPLISSQTFMVIDEVSLYNDILGRPWIGKINVIISTLGAVLARSTTIKQCSTQWLKRSKKTQFLLVNQADLNGVKHAEEKEDHAPDCQTG
ncbi:unnamed protein product [Prunus armeniaca]